MKSKRCYESSVQGSSNVLNPQCCRLLSELNIHCLPADDAEMELNSEDLSVEERAIRHIFPASIVIAAFSSCHE